MAAFIESLESRTLLSAAPSVIALKAEGRVVDADLLAYGKVGKANLKLIEADLKTAGELKTSKGLLKALIVEGAAGFAVTVRGIKVTDALIKADLNRIVADGARFDRRPTATAGAKLTAADDTLVTNASTRLNTINADIAAERTTNDANSKALATANPGNATLSTDLSTTIADSAAAARTALINAATTALTLDVDAVTAAFPG